MLVGHTHFSPDQYFGWLRGSIEKQGFPQVHSFQKSFLNQQIQEWIECSLHLTVIVGTVYLATTTHFHWPVNNVRCVVAVSFRHWVVFYDYWIQQLPINMCKYTHNFVTWRTWIDKNKIDTHNVLLPCHTTTRLTWPPSCVAASTKGESCTP